MQALRAALAVEDIQIHYVMSDFTPQNIAYWESHPALQSYIAEGLVDFSLFNLEDEAPITLMHKKITLSNETMVNPLIVFANYIFDTVSHDMFSVKQNKLHEVLVTLSTDAENMKEGKPSDWEKIHIEHHPVEINGHYYPEPELNSVLHEYKEHLQDSHFLLPIGAIHAIEKLQRLANGKMLLMGSDKGYSSLDSQNNLGYPKLAFHGSFSVMVNFHAIARFFKHAGGDYLLQGPHKEIQTAVFSMGFQLHEMKETALAIQKFVEELSVADYFILYREIEKHLKKYPLETLASQLAFSAWDPYLFMRLKDRLFELVAEADHSTLHYLADHMKKIRDNYYVIPEERNPILEIAMFFHLIRCEPWRAEGEGE